MCVSITLTVWCHICDIFYASSLQFKQMLLQSSIIYVIYELATL